MGHMGDKHRGFARSRHCQQEHRPAAGHYRRPLLGAELDLEILFEIIKERLLLHLPISPLSFAVFILPHPGLLGKG